MSPEAAGQVIDYEESGEGPTILFVSGSYATPSAWRGVQNALPKAYRFVATSQCGYGKTAETRTAGECGIRHNIAVVRAAAARAGAPVHLVGHSWGAMVALAAVLEGGIDVLSLTCFEANPWSLLRQRGRGDLVADMRAMAVGFEDAVARGDRDACRIIIDYWGGPGAFAAMPPKAQDYCRTVPAANVLDWRGYFAYETDPALLRALDLPLLFVRGSKAIPATIEIAEALGDTVPGARLAVVDGANHFLIATHPAQCAELLHDHVQAVEGARAASPAAQ